VANAFKKVGLLPSDIAAAQYWPGSFSNENKTKEVQLLKGAKLGEELIVEFKK